MDSVMEPLALPWIETRCKAFDQQVSAQLASPTKN